ncbi:MAG: hypothetical protein Tsb0021_10100 [Chlamydiales bacterium]
MALLNLKKKSKLKEIHRQGETPVLETHEREELLQTKLSEDEEQRLMQSFTSLVIDQNLAIPREEINQAIEQLKTLAINIRQIQKQTVIQIGEKIDRARTLLQKYGDTTRTFTEWLELTFNSRRTAFNILSLYDLYKNTQEKVLREKIIGIPLKAAYQIASRNIEIGEKLAFIEEFNGDKAEDWIEALRTRFPAETHSKKSSYHPYFQQIEKALHILQKRSKQFKTQDWRRIKEIAGQLQKILDYENNKK